MLNPIDSVKKRTHEMMLPVSSYFRRRQLKNTNFSIIASNCIGARIYQELGISYSTPFVGLFICAPDYIKLLKNLKHYLNLPIEFVEKSKYENQNNFKIDHKYPIGLLGGDIEIHFMHYKTREEVKLKWNRRLKRINWNNLFITFTDRDFCTNDLLHEFDSLLFEHKVCFTAKNNREIKSSVWIKDDHDQPYVRDLYTYHHYLKKNFDFVEWLNSTNTSRINVSK